MCPMGLTGRRRLAALALGLLLPLAACSEETLPSPDTRAGDQIGGRGNDLQPREGTSVLTPAGRLRVSLADAVSRLEKEQTTDLTARNPPNGGSFVPLVWSFQDDIYGDVASLFGDRKPLEVALVADGASYKLTPPEARSGATAEYVAVKGPGEDVRLEVTYDGATQTLDAETGKLDMGVAKGLYRLPKIKLKRKDCRVRNWVIKPGVLVFPRFQCQATTAVPSPYVANEWVKEPGHAWVSVTLASNLGHFAIREPDGSLATYRVKGSTELSTVEGKKPLGTLQERIEGGYASGTLVFDIKGKLPKTVHLLREYELRLDDASSKSSAPKKRSEKIGGDVDLFY